METFLLRTVERFLYMQGSSSSSRWTADDRLRIVMESFTTKISLAGLQKLQPETKRIFSWKQKFIECGKLVLTGSSENVNK
jgi:hypothetical protein